MIVRAMFRENYGLAVQVLPKDIWETKNLQIKSSYLMNMVNGTEPVIWGASGMMEQSNSWEDRTGK